jgi:hypothetical protein
MSRFPLAPVIRATILSLLLAAPLYPSAKIPKDHAQQRAFRLANPCPSTGATTGDCPGFVIRYIRPRPCGGTDTPDNMEWRSDAMEKHHDKADEKACKKQKIQP